MTQISRRPLRKEVEERVFEVFLETIAMVSTRTQVRKLLEDWLSPTEKVMLAKRLAIALLLTKQYDQRSIANVLKVGLETVNKVNRALRDGTGGYEMVMKVFLKQEKHNAFWQKVDDMLADILPPHHHDWSRWRKEQWKEKMSKQKPF